MNAVKLLHNLIFIHGRPHSFLTLSLISLGNRPESAHLLLNRDLMPLSHMLLDLGVLKPRYTVPDVFANIESVAVF